MRIKRLEIHGFKSFMDKTVFHFTGGMTAVVGPNGCGKSNIVDAILWCMGEQSPKQLRGKEMQDVIFAGSESRPPMGLAEVSLFFEMEEPSRVPETDSAVDAAVEPSHTLTQFTEVQVTRRLFRSGESEYWMNKTPCRLRDIQELFMDAGLGKGAYSIIEQGKVGLIVSSRPEERRILLEEAAGIAKFKSRKKAALAKMEQTEQNLLRVNDVVVELAKQMASLDRQAKKAERYRKMRDEVRAVDLKVAAAEHERRLRELEAEQAALAELREREISAAAEIANAEGEMEVVRGKLVDEERLLSGIQERLFEENNRIQLDEKNVEYSTRELERLKEAAETATAEIARLAGERTRIGEELLRGAEERERLEREIAESIDAIALKSDAVVASRAALGALNQRIDELKGRVVEAMQMVAATRNARVGLEKRDADLAMRLEREESERDEVAARVARDRRAVDEGARLLSELKQMKLGLAHRKEEHDRLRERLGADLAAAEGSLQETSARRTAKRSRLESLLELKSSYEGYHKGVREVMTRAGATGSLAVLGDEPEEATPLPAAAPPVLGPPTDGGASMVSAAWGSSAISTATSARELAAVDVQSAGELPGAKTGAGATPAAALHGVFGLVAEYLEVPPRFETALEAVLGDRLQAVIVARHDEGLDALSFLKAEAKGRGTFLPLDLDLPAPAAGRIDRGARGILGPLLEQVTVRSEFASVATYLLQDVVVAETLDAALSARAAHRGARRTWVTLEGEVIDAAGALTGGSREGLATGLLQRKREVKELYREVAELEQAHAQRALAREQAARSLSQVEEAIEALAKSEHEEEIRCLEQEKDLAAVRERLERDRQRLEVLEFEAGEIRRQRDEVAAERAEAERRIETLGCRREEDARTLDDLSGQARVVAQEIETLGNAETAARVEMAERRSRRDALAAALERLERGRLDVEGRIERLNRQMEEGAAEEVRLTGSIEALRASIADRVREAERLRLELLASREAFDAETHALRERESSVKNLRRHLAELRDATAGAQVKETELAMGLKHAVQQVAERYNEDLDSRFRDWIDPALDLEAASAQVAELKERMARLGEVNLTAIEEYAEVAQRHDFLAGQKADLEQTLAQLRDTIAKINRTSKERFLETFEKVNERFQELFPKLFRGGKAHLVLTDSDDLLEAGIDIVAQPPGKKLQNINLLSGGEKALTAVSLIMAIFLIRPTPFCLLDEVDAPLDEANVGRYNEIVREMSARTQFIVITHNKNTMARCDALYGITMEEPGVSKMVSVKFHGERIQTPAVA